MLLTSESDGSLRLRPFRAVAEVNRGMLADLADPETSMVDELIADRLAEEAREGVKDVPRRLGPARLPPR